MTTTTKSLSINAVCSRYHELGHNSDIKLFFRKSEVKKHNSDKPPSFFTVRPILVKVGNWFDDYINFSFVIKNKYKHVIDSKQIDLWCLTINKEIKTFTLEDDNTECEFHETSLQFISNPKLVSSIEKLYMASSNVSEMVADSF